MSTVKSLEDLKRIREEVLKKRQLKAESGHIEIFIGMGTPGIAVGARDTMKAILKYIEEHSLSDIVVRQAGNIGLDSWEPVVQVTIGAEHKVTYGKVTPFVAHQIMQDHIVGGKPVKAYIIEA